MSPCVHLCSTDGRAQRPSSLETNPTMEHQLKHIGSPVAIPPSISEESGTDFTSKLMQNEKLLVVPDEPANAPSSDVKAVAVTGSSSHHSSYLQQSRPAVSPPLSSVSTGILAKLRS